MLKLEAKSYQAVREDLFQDWIVPKKYTYVRGLTHSTGHADFVLQDRIGENGSASWSRCIKTSRSQFAIAYMCNIKIWLQNGYICYKLVISSTSKFHMIHWDWFRRRNRRNPWFKKYSTKDLSSKRLANKVFVKTTFRIGPCQAKYIIFK